MGYRGDDEALRARADSLESRLKEAQAELDQSERELDAHVQKDKKDEGDIAALRSEVNGLRRKLGLSTDEAPGPDTRARVVMGALVVLALMLGGVVAFVLVAPAGTAKEAPAFVEVADPVLVEKPEPIAALELPVPPAPAPSRIAPTGRPTDVAAFGAVVTEATGDALAVGEGAVLWVSLGPDSEVSSVRLIGPRGTVYDSTDDPGTSIVVTETRLGRRAGPEPASQVHTLVHTDQGMRTGPRPRIEINTSVHRIWVGRDVSPTFTATLYVDVESAPRFDAQSLPGPLFRTVRVRAVPRDVVGDAPREVSAASSSEPCELVVHALSRAGFSCRMSLRCGDNVVYGATTSGLNHCSVVDGLPALATDDGVTSEDGDPAITFDLPNRTMIVRDGWRGTFDLSEDPRCDLTGRWRGEAVSIRRGDGTMSLFLEGEGAAATAAWRDAEGPMGVEEVPAEFTCLEGRAMLGPTRRLEGERLAEGSYEAFYGPDYATLMGRYYGEEAVPGVFFLVRGAEAAEVE